MNIHMLAVNVAALVISSFLLFLAVTQADNQVDHVRQHFYEVSLEYVFKVQEVQERKMFEFVEPVNTHSLSHTSANHFPVTWRRFLNVCECFLRDTSLVVFMA